VHLSQIDNLFVLNITVKQNCTTRASSTSKIDLADEQKKKMCVIFLQMKLPRPNFSVWQPWIRNISMSTVCCYRNMVDSGFPSSKAELFHLWYF